VEQVVFADSWQSVFADCGLNSFEDFFYCSAVENTNGNSKSREVNTLMLGNGRERKVLFLTRFHNPRPRDMLFSINNFGRRCSQAACEWKNTNILLKNGIETYRPVCYGEQTRLGLERKSFFVTEKIQQRCLTDFIADDWPGGVDKLAGKVKRYSNILSVKRPPREY